MSARGPRELPWYLDAPPFRRWIARLEAAGDAEEAWSRVARWVRMVDEHGVVKVERRDRVGIVTLAYPPKANALVPPMYGLFVDAVERLERDDDIWVIVIRGEGEHFSTGGYVGPDAFYAGLDSGEDATRAEPMRRTQTELFQTMPKAIFACEKPTVALINGPVMAESVDLALAADLRTAHAETEFRFSFARTGNTAFSGAAWALPRLIGVSRAKQLLLAAEWIDGERAYEFGLVNYLYDRDSCVTETLALAERIAGMPPITQRLLKKEITLGLGIDTYPAALDTYSMIETIVQFTEDHMDAERAVVEKRSPTVVGF